MFKLDKPATAGMLALLVAVACVRPDLAPRAVMTPPHPAAPPAEVSREVPLPTSSGKVVAVHTAQRANVQPSAVSGSLAWKSLPNGARVQFLPDRLVGTVAVDLWVSGGVASEPDGALGVSHLCERLLLHELAASVHDRIRAIGGEVSSFTTLDHTVFHLLLPQGRAELALDFLTAILTPPAPFDEPMLNRQREQALLEQRRTQLSPRSLAVEKLRELSFPGHPYGRPLLGDKDRLLTLRVGEVVAFYERSYQPAHVTVVASGAVTDSLANPLLSLVSGLKGSASPSGQEPSTVDDPPRLKKPQVLVAVHDDPAGQAVVAAALPGVAASAEDAAALDLWAQLLRTGRGLRTLGTRPGSEVSALSFAGRMPGLLLLEAAVPPVQLEEATQKLLSELFRLSQRDIEPGELLRAKQRLLGETALLLDTPSGRARRAGQFTSLGISEERYEQNVRELSEVALRKTILRYLRRDALALLWLLPRTRSPRDELTQLERARQRLLSQLQPVGPSVVPASTTPAKASDGVWRYQVPGGPLLLVVPDHSVKVVGAAASWPGGLRLEDEPTAGSHVLLTRLWPHSPRGRGGASFAESMSQLRGTVATQLDLDGFGVVGEWPSLMEDEALPLFLDGLSPPEPSESDFERERRQLVAETRHLEEGLQPSLRLLKHHLYAGHPYHLEPSVQSLSGLSRRRLLELLRRAYSPSQMTLAIVGDIEPHTVLSLVESRLQTSSHPVPHPVAAPPPSEAPKQFLSYHARDQALLALGFRIPGLQSSDRAALLLLHEVLLGDGGRLQRELVERRGLLLKLEGRLERGLLGGALLFGAVTTPSSLDSAEASLRDELRRLLDHPLSDDELRTTQQRLLGRDATKRQRRGELALALARRSALGLPSSEEEDRQLLSLTASQVQEVARRYLDERHAVLQALLPHSLLSVKHGDTQSAKPKLLAKLEPKPSAKPGKPQLSIKNSGSTKAVRKKGSRR